MGIGNKFRNLVFSSFNILATTVLALLLLLLEKLVESDFKCPKDYKLAIAYSVLFIFLPWLILLALGFKFSELKISWYRCIDFIFFKQYILPCTIGWTNSYDWLNSNLYHLVRIFTAPFIWFCIIMADGRYIGCLQKSILGDAQNSNAESICQILGLVGICLLIIISLFVPSSKCVDDAIDKWYRNNFEDYLIQEAEKQVREKAKEKQKALVKEWVQKIFPDDDETFKTKNQNWMKVVEHIVYDARERAKREFPNMPILPYIPARKIKPDAKDRPGAQAKEPAAGIEEAQV